MSIRSIRSAVSAGPASISDEAAVLDWSMNEPWLDFLNAYMNQTQPTYSEIGIAYMLMGDSPVSNSDPYATEPTSADDWVTGVAAHLMIPIDSR